VTASSSSISMLNAKRATCAERLQFCVTNLEREKTSSEIMDRNGLRLVWLLIYSWHETGTQHPDIFGKAEVLCRFLQRDVF
jgi:hypothetical protein